MLVVEEAAKIVKDARMERNRFFHFENTRKHCVYKPCEFNRN